jgi:hypothetical protein
VRATCTCCRWGRSPTSNANPTCSPTADLVGPTVQ